MNDVTTDGSDDAGQNEGKKTAIRLLARSLWREGIAVPEDAGDDASEDDGEANRSEWKEKRTEYVKLARKLYKRLDRQGGTLTAPETTDQDEAE